MDGVIAIFTDLGEVGIDKYEIGMGNGPYYVKLYDGSFDSIGYDTLQEALEEMAHIWSMRNMEDA